MKIQERTGAAHGRGSAPAQSVGDRLPSAPRERKPALAALAVLLILVGALGATVLVLRAGDRVEVIKITKNVTAGEKITSSDFDSVMVAEDSGVHYVKYSQRGQLDDLVAKTDIPGGSLLVGEMLTGNSGAVPEGKVLVGLALKAGQYPTDLKPGDTVAAYGVGDSDNTGSGSQSPSGDPLVAQAKVRTLRSGDADGVGGGDLPVSILVDQADAGKLTKAAAAGEVSLVQVAKSSG